MAKAKYKAISVSDFDSDIVGEKLETPLRCEHCTKVLLETTPEMPEGTLIEIKCQRCKHIVLFGQATGDVVKKLREIRCVSCNKLLFRIAGEAGATIEKECPRAGCRSTNRIVFV